jgi:hypothetical protein
MQRKQQKTKYGKKPKQPENPNLKVSLIRAYGPIDSSLTYQPRWARRIMKYSEIFLPSVAGTGVYDQIFRANSMFDPDRTGGGHQPRGFDQLTPQYNRYRVIAFNWHVEFAGAALSYNIVTTVVNGAQTFTTLVDAAESNRKADSIISTAQGNTRFQMGGEKLHLVNGKSFQSYNIDDTTGAIFNATPVETMDLHIVLYNPNSVSIVINYVVTLEYDCIFYDSIVPAIS